MTNAIRDDVYDYATHIDTVYGEYLAYRWGGGALHGKWFVGMFFEPMNRFVCCHCVVDDFGSLVPVKARLSYNLEAS